MYDDVLHARRGGGVSILDRAERHPVKSDFYSIFCMLNNKHFIECPSGLPLNQTTVQQNNETESLFR